MLSGPSKYTQDAQYFYWDKSDNPKLSDHFWGNEFKCRCGYKTCIRQRISKELIAKLERMRTHLEQPLSIHSGFRCEKRQADIRNAGRETAKGTSTHERGDAADVSAKSMNELRHLASEEFKAIGLASSFIHVDLRDDKIRRWNYVNV